ncbi:MAG: hypothetical protein ABI743_02230, partial [bacterium]
ESGYTVMTNSAGPTNGDTTQPADPNGWRWLGPVTSGTGYNDISSPSMTSWFAPIAGQTGGSNFNWGNTGGAIAETYSRLNATTGTVTNNENYICVGFATTVNLSNEDARFDDFAWMVY